MQLKLRRIPALLAITCCLFSQVAMRVHAQEQAAADDGTAPIDQVNAAHNIGDVFLIVMENHNWTGSRGIKGNPAAPYINHTLIPMASHANNYYNPAGNHPSLPNYLWLEAGSNLGVHADGPPSQYHRGTHQHLVNLLHNAGISWRAYEENISGSTCPLYDSSAYAVRHDPFVYFDDVTGNRNPHSSTCIWHIRPFGQLAHDLGANTVARYNFITPNLCHDMHDSCGGNAIAHGDAWLASVVPQILRSTAYRNNGVLFITWDEAARGDGPIPMIVLSPLAKGNGYSNGLYYTHSSTLRTIEEILGVGPLLGSAASTRDLRDLFRVFP